MEVQLQQPYSIPVETIKTSTDYSYFATDTVEDLKNKIFENEGIPPNRQRLFVQYGWRRWWTRVEISGKTNDLLVTHLQTASKIRLYITLGQQSLPV